MEFWFILEEMQGGEEENILQWMMIKYVNVSQTHKRNE